MQDLSLLTEQFGDVQCDFFSLIELAESGVSDCGLAILIGQPLIQEFLVISEGVRHIIWESLSEKLDCLVIEKMDPIRK